MPFNIAQRWPLAQGDDDKHSREDETALHANTTTAILNEVLVKEGKVHRKKSRASGDTTRPHRLPVLCDLEGPLEVCMYPGVVMRCSAYALPMLLRPDLRAIIVHTARTHRVGTSCKHAWSGKWN